MELRQTDESTVLLIGDNGDEVAWNVSVFDRTKFSTVQDVFRDINGYWSRLTENRRARIFEIYREIHNTLETVADLKRLEARLIAHVAAFYEEMPLAEIEHWVKYYGNIRLPENLKTEYDPDDPNPGRTYLKSDYQGLVVMTVAVRPMVPIWGEYIRRIKEQSGATFKEYAAMRLLSRSHLVSSQPLERLKLYIESSMQYEKKNNAAVLQGLGTEELPEWLLSIVVIRRMAVGEADAADDRGSIISNIYGFVSNTLKDLDRKFGGGVKEKHPEDTGMDDEGSKVESYKVKQEIDAGLRVMFSVYTEKVREMVHRIDPTVPTEMIDECFRHAERQTGLPIAKHHVTLCQYVMDPVLTAPAIPCLNKPALLRVMAATQSILWHWGFPELAAMATAEAVDLGRDTLLVTDSRSRIPNELLEELNVLYPHGEQADRNNPTVRKNNAAYKAIVALSKEMASGSWRLSAPIALAKQCQGVDSQLRMVAPPNVAELLAKLVIKLARS